MPQFVTASAVALLSQPVAPLGPNAHARRSGPERPQARFELRHRSRRIDVHEGIEPDALGKTSARLQRIVEQAGEKLGRLLRRPGRNHARLHPARNGFLGK